IFSLFLPFFPSSYFYRPPFPPKFEPPFTAPLSSGRSQDFAHLLVLLPILLLAILRTILGDFTSAAPQQLQAPSLLLATDRTLALEHLIFLLRHLPEILYLRRVRDRVQPSQRDPRAVFLEHFPREPASELPFPAG